MGAKQQPISVHIILLLITYFAHQGMSIKLLLDWFDKTVLNVFNFHNVFFNFFFTLHSWSISKMPFFYILQMKDVDLTDLKI